MTGFQSPNHTQVPNDLFDEYLAELGEAELRVILAIIRATLGFHRRQLPLSLTTLSKKTGLSRKAVVAAASSLIERGLVSKQIQKGVNVWTLHWKDDPDMAVPLVTLGNQQEEAVVPQGDHQVVTQGNQTSYPRLPRIKESSKETDGKKEIARPKNGRARGRTQSEKVRDQLAEWFTKQSGIERPESWAEYRKRWEKPLLDLFRRCGMNSQKTEDLIASTIQRMRKQDLDMDAPQSIEKVARSILGKRRSDPWESRETKEFFG